MGKSIKDNLKRRGRPATGNAPLVGVRMTSELQEVIRAWAAKQSDRPALATAIRRLVEIGLKNAAVPKPRRSTSNKIRAQELAAKAIDKMSDDLASAVDQANRKKRLTKGPQEFREDRLDLPKAKGK